MYDFSYFIRYSGCYDTSAQPTIPEKTPLTVSNSLSAISALTTSTGKFDLKSASSFLGKTDDDRDTTRDSIAVVEDNRVELERLVEQINSDLTTAAQHSQPTEGTNGTRMRNVSTSSIERFLTSTSVPLIPPKQPQNSQHLQIPQLQLGQPVPSADQDKEVSKQQLHPRSTSELPSKQSETNTQPSSLHRSAYQSKEVTPSAKTPTENSKPNLLESMQEPTITYTISGDEALEVALTESVKNTAITNGEEHQSNMTLVLKAEVGPVAHDLTVNDILDTVGPNADDTLALELDDTALQTPATRSENPRLPEDSKINKCKFTSSKKFAILICDLRQIVRLWSTGKISCGTKYNTLR